MSGHGFRSSASSMLNNRAFGTPTPSNASWRMWTMTAIRRAYARADFWDERVRIMAWWAERCWDMRRGGIVVALKADDFRLIGAPSLGTINSSPNKIKYLSQNSQSKNREYVASDNVSDNTREISLSAKSATFCHCADPPHITSLRPKASRAQHVGSNEPARARR